MGAPSDLAIRVLDAETADFETRLQALLSRRDDDREAAERIAAAVIVDVREHGDDALLRLSRRYDGLSVTAAEQFEIPGHKLDAAWRSLPKAERAALDAAAERIRRYHEHQPLGAFEYVDENGRRLGQRVTPLRRVGVYVPGGQAAYPSTVLMTVVPARVAGVEEVIAVTPPPGARHPHVLAAMRIAGVDRVFAVGGAHAVAALAYGTATLPQVDKIVGPGGAVVAAAKRLVFGRVGIDLDAGPSEVVIVADGSAPARWIALDLFAQAEHDAAAQSVLLTPDADYMRAVRAAMEQAWPSMSRREIIGQSLANRGALIKVPDLQAACALANRFAPEHLELAVRDPEAWLGAIRNAGAVFLGAEAAEVLGDYGAGPSHVLPTFGSARYASPLSVTDFQKRMSIVHGDRSWADVAGIAATIAEAEGLTAHAASARARMEPRDAAVAAAGR